MELFGLVLAMPIAFVAGAIYSRLLRLIVDRWPPVRVVLWPALAVLALLVVEWMALAAVGPSQLHGALGSAFLVMHFAVFMLSIPALATTLVVRKAGTVWGSWGAVGLCCAALALPLVLTQYGVAEAVYGIE